MRNTGDNSTGYRSTGDNSTGNRSTGDYSTGYASTGDKSTGNNSTGDWSISNYSTGHFSTIDYSGFGSFNKPCTVEQWENVEKPDLLYFNLTEWIDSKNMTDSEKEDSASYKVNGGYLKVYDYKEAFQESYNKASKEDKELLLKLPNFDADVFFEISGIDVRKPEKTLEDLELKNSALNDIDEIAGQYKYLAERAISEFCSHVESGGSIDYGTADKLRNELEELGK